MVLNANGLSKITKDLLDNWIAPVFIVVVAAVALTFLFKREFRNLATFLIIAAVVGAMIFFGDMLFGKNGTFSKLAKDSAQTINTIAPIWLGQIKLTFLNFFG